MFAVGGVWRVVMYGAWHDTTLRDVVCVRACGVWNVLCDVCIWYVRSVCAVRALVCVQCAFVCLHVHERMHGCVCRVYGVCIVRIFRNVHNGRSVAFPCTRRDVVLYGVVCVYGLYARSHL